jgi:hypothetical protein
VATLIVLIGVAMLLSSASDSRVTVAGAADTSSSDFFYLPLIVGPAACQGASGQGYAGGAAFQFDRDDPVRFAFEHADKNLALRGYSLNTDSGLKRELLDFGSDDPTRPPQMATLFSPARVPALPNFYRIGHWIWGSPPDPGVRGDPVTSPPVTALGLQSSPGEALHVPSSGYDIGGGMEVLLIFADEDSVTLRYTREDSSGSPGYTLHVDNICTDPNLLALYESLDAPDGPRYVFVPPKNRPYAYNLPTLPAGQSFGTARDSEIVVAIVDTGTFMDPRSCNEWWQVRPGYGGACPRP